MMDEYFQGFCFVFYSDLFLKSTQAHMHTQTHTRTCMYTLRLLPNSCFFSSIYDSVVCLSINNVDECD